jgi:hypothetical protein
MKHNNGPVELFQCPTPLKIQRHQKIPEVQIYVPWLY